MRHAIVIAVLGALALAGCERKPAPQSAAPAPTSAQAPAAFSSSSAFDAAGYYLPIAPIQVGDHRLAHISVGAPSDFAQWQEGKREGVFGPLIFQFWDVTSPVEHNELGQDGYKTRISVLPSQYVFEPGGFEFTGEDPKLGKITFRGGFDVKALEAVKAEPNEATPVLSGELTIGDKTFPDARFGYWVGD